MLTYIKAKFTSRSIPVLMVVNFVVSYFVHLVARETTSVWVVLALKFFVV